MKTLDEMHLVFLFEPVGINCNFIHIIYIIMCIYLDRRGIFEYNIRDERRNP